MQRRSFITACVSFGLIPLLGIHGCSTHISRGNAGRTGVLRTLRYGFTLENPGGTTLTNQKLWFYAPVKSTAMQKLQVADVNLPHQILEDALGNSIIEVTLPQLPPYATKLLNIEVQVSLSHLPQTQEGAGARFLGAEPFIEADHSMVVSLARELQRQNNLSTAKAIYDWVKDNVRYAGYVSDDKGALQALQDLRGDCTESAYLVCALARANQIPARVMGGYVADRDTVIQADSYHNWAELFIDGRWQLVDAQRGRFMIEADHYIAFQIFSLGVSNALNGFHRFRVEGSLVAKMN